MNKIYYKDLLDLGFERTEHDDKIFFNHYGYNYFIFSKEFEKDGVEHTLEWDSTTREVSYFIDHKIAERRVCLERVKRLLNKQ